MRFWRPARTRRKAIGTTTRRARCTGFPQAIAATLCDAIPPSTGRASWRVPAGAAPIAAAGVAVSLFTDKLEEPRLIRVAPNGDIFVAESQAGRIRVLRAGGDGANPSVASTFAADLDAPFGIAFYPPGPDPQFVYVGDTDAVKRFPYRNGDLKARGPAETLVKDLWSSGGHWTRDIAFSADGKRMFVSVGSGSNVADGMPGDPPGGLAAFAASHPLGAAWDNEENRADVLEFDPLGKGLHIYATGIRNCVTVPIDPATGTLYCVTNERDGLGDNLPPDYVTSVQAGRVLWLALVLHRRSSRSATPA